MSNHIHRVGSNFRGITQGVLHRCVLALSMICMLAAGFTVRADEGMWLLPLLAKQNMERMREMGLELTASEIFDSRRNGTLTDAIVRFGRGCTGSVISKDGLVLTNHHCGHSYIQQLSSLSNNYLENGFIADKLSAELPAPGLTVTFVRDIVDVTDSILTRLPASVAETQRAQLVDSFSFELAKRYMERFPSYDAHVQEFYQGNRYYLFLYETFRDVRLVAAPPVSIGSFGGDTDNWFYPRHTGDFSLFRIYAGAGNRAAEYSRDNVPYKPKRYLTISLDGYREGDFAMILGFPGRTQRFMTTHELTNKMEVENYNRALIRGLKQSIWKKHMDADPQVKIQYAAKYKQSSNYWKNAIGQNQALKREGVMAQRAEREREFVNWIGATKARTEQYLQALPILQRGNERIRDSRFDRMYYIEAIYMGCEFTQLYPNFTTLGKLIDSDNTAAIDALRTKVKTTLKDSWFKDYSATVDRETTVRMLTLAREKLSPENLPSFYKTIDQKFKGNVEAYVDDLFRESVLVDYDRLVKFLEKPTRKQLQKDPGFAMCESFFGAMASLYTKMQPLSDSLTQANRLWVQGLMEKGKDTPMYPDANGTIRLTYGSVMRMVPRDAVEYNHFTTMDGLIAKIDDEDPDFRAPEKLRQIHKLRDYDRYADEAGVMRVNFITNNDITGGNSGSPVLNARGELIGLAFDGNWEALSGDICFSPRVQRCINVDIRYVLLILHKYAGATRIIDELSFAQPDEPVKRAKK